MIFESFIAFSVVFLCTWLYFLQLKRNNYKSSSGKIPPGPSSHPLFGGISFFTSTPVELARKWKLMYGNIVSIKLDDGNVMLISDYELIKEAFGNPAFCGRPDLKSTEIVTPTRCRRGIVHVENSSWIEQRKFITKNLRDFGFGTKSIEGIIHQECTESIGFIKQHLGKPIVINGCIEGGVLNSLWQTFTGQRFSKDKLPKVSSDLKQVVSASFATEIFIPSIKRLFLNANSTNKELESSVNSIKQLIQDQIDSHKETFNEEDLRDLMDVYIEEIRGTKDSSSSFFGTVGEENMLASILDLIGGGSQTTSSTILWGIYYIINNKEVQRKMQEEIDLVVGHYRLPGLKDQLEMPYTAAIILETLRLSSILPLGLPHRTVSDVNFHGYEIPKGTLVLANLSDIHYDEKTWKDPENFQPERLLTPDEKELLKKYSPLVWNSVGRRLCPGEIIAKDIIFAFLVSFFQRFTIASYDGKPSKAEGDFLRVPSGFKIVVEDRLEFLDRKDLNEHINDK